MRTSFSILLLFLVIVSSANNFSTTQLNQDSVHFENDNPKLLKNNKVNSNFVDNNKDRITYDWQSSMPWIAAILIGLLTVLANLIISNQNRKLNLEIIDKQIRNSKEIALAQIDNASKAVQLNFNKTVLSGNRQLWINDLRELISKILSKTMIITIKQSLSNEEFEDLRCLLTKADLMLNTEDDKEYISALLELENCCLQVLMGNKDPQDLEQYSTIVKSYTQKTLKTEWERVKQGV